MTTIVSLLDLVIRSLHAKRIKTINLNSVKMNNSLNHFPTTVKFLIKDSLTVYFL